MLLIILSSYQQCPLPLTVVLLTVILSKYLQYPVPLTLTKRGSFMTDGRQDFTELNSSKTLLNCSMDEYGVITNNSLYMYIQPVGYGCSSIVVNVTGCCTSVCMELRSVGEDSLQNLRHAFLSLLIFSGEPSLLYS